MRKIISTALLLLLCFNASIAQTSNIRYSTAFDEPEEGWNKVFQLSNGNTFYFHFTKKEGIEIVVYNSNRQEISRKTVSSELWEPRKMRESVVEGIYEINGQPVVFLHQTLDKTPTLFRLKFNATTGELDGEKQISTLPRYKAGAAWAMAYGGVEQEDFFIEKDPNSDCYAVVNFNSFASESDERVEVVHYGIENGNHKVLNRAFYDAQGFKYLRYIGMMVDGDKRVFMCTYGYNTKKSGGADSRVIISRLSKGDKQFTNKLIDFTDDFKDTKSIMAYNPGSGMIQLMTLTLMSSKSRFFSSTTSNYYLTLMNYIDPESLFIVSTKPLLAAKVSSYCEQNFNYDRGYSGMPQQMVINNDNSTTVLMEEMTKQITVNSAGQVISARTTLGGIGFSELDMKGNEQEGYAFIKSQMANGLMEPLYLSAKSKGLWSYKRGGVMIGDNNAFLSFDYINTDKNRYILFNDYPKNFNNDQSIKHKSVVVAISKANTVCYKLKDGKREKYYLFGKPVDEDEESKFCYVESSHFDKKTSTYATLLMERHGKDKQAKIAWVKFD